MASDVGTGTGTDQTTAIFSAHQAFFSSGKTLSYEFRKAQLEKLSRVIDEYEPRIAEALRLDMGKPYIEAFGGEIGFVKKEIRHSLRYLRRWMQDEPVPTSIAHWPSNSWIQYRPKGVVLIVSPWNYPFNLLFTPLVGAMAAGNCAVLKPSEQAHHTAKVIEEMITENFDPGYLSVSRMPGRSVISRLIEPHRFDHIFFTGSETAGREVYRAAARHLTPVTLELGGKSPALVLSDADIDLSAKRIVWGKCFNAGQTCVAPDYALVPRALEARIVERMKAHIQDFHGEKPLDSPYMTLIVNEGRFEHLRGLLKNAEVLFGGSMDRERLRIEPTIVRVSPDHPLMQEEIFGPILPVIAYDSEQDVLDIVQRNPNPLAFYLFTKSKKEERRWLRKFAFGGGGVNTALIHVASTELPFGGVGNSGMGRYHGKYSFDLFSISQGISKTRLWPDIFLRYPPYTKLQQKLARWFYG